MGHDDRAGTRDGAEIARRVEQVIDGANRVALEILREAQEEAAGRRREAAAGIEAEVAELHRMASEVADAAAALRDRAARVLGAGADASPHAPDLVAGRLAAMQMAAENRPRAEVERHLRDRYGVADAGSILDDLYGREAV